MTMRIEPTSADVRLMLHTCGLSQTDAADFLGVDARIVRRWNSGYFSIPPEQWQKLEKLSAQQDRAAHEAIEEMEERYADYDHVKIPVRLTRTDEDARKLGYPCAGAHLAVVRRVAELAATKGMRIVPMHPDLDARDAEAEAIRRVVEWFETPLSSLVSR